MRRGFKKDARELAAEIRSELGLDEFAPLDAFELARHLDIPVWDLSSYRVQVPNAVAVLGSEEAGAFSAMLVFDGLYRVIVYNDAHAQTRQQADVSHELAHALLLHRPQPRTCGAAPHFDCEQEEEAKWLGAVLLVSDEYCVNSVKNGVALSAAAAALGVSPSLMRWRINMSGAHQRAARATV